MMIANLLIMIKLVTCQQSTLAMQNLHTYLFGGVYNREVIPLVFNGTADVYV